MLCDYGCNQEAKFLMSNNKWCCSKHYNSCPKIRSKIRKTVKSLYKDINSSYNKNRKDISKKQSKSQKIAWSKDTHKCKTIEVKKIQREKHLLNRKEGIYDTKEYREKLSITHKKI